MNRHDYRRFRDRRDPPRPPKRGGGRWVFWLFLGLGVAFVASYRFAGVSAPVQAPRPAKPLASLRGKDLQEQVAEQGVLGGAKAGRDALAAASKLQADKQIAAAVGDHDPFSDGPRVEKTDRGYRVVGARSEKNYVMPRDEARAKEDALRVARGRLAEELGGLSPAVEETGYRVESPADDIKAKWAAAGMEPDRGWVVVDVQTSEQAIRAERSKVRFHQIGFWVGAGFLVLLTGYGFLRLDAWTKGYLTTALGVIAVLLIGGGILALTMAVH